MSLGLSGFRRGIGSALVLVLLLGSAGVLAGPTQKEQGDLAKPLAKKVSVDLIGTPLPRALETLARNSGVNIFITPSYANQLQRAAVTLTIKDLPAAKALNLIGLATQTDWYIQEGVVMVAPKRYVQSLRIETEVYNIRELVDSVPNFLGRDLSIDGTLSNTNTGGSSAGQGSTYGKGGSGGGGLFGDDADSDVDEDRPSRQELVSQITDLIQKTTADEDLWTNGDFRITEFKGSLIIKATPEVHKKIGSLLGVLSKTSGRMVVVEGQFFAVPRGVVDKLDGKLVLKAEAYKKFSAVLKQGANTNIRRLASCRTVCFNSQRVYVYAGKDATMLSDIEPIPDAFGVDPTLSTLYAGAVMDVKPTIALDGKHISIGVRSEAVHNTGMKTTALPVGSAGSDVVSVSSSKPANKASDKDDADDADDDKEVPTRTRSVKVSNSPKQTGTAQLGLPSQEIVTYRTNVRIPDGGAVILTGVTSQFQGIDADGMEMVFVLRARIVE